MVAINPFEHQSKLIQGAVTQERIAIAGLSILGALSFAAAITYKQVMPKVSIASALAISSISAGMSGAISISGSRKQKFYSGFNAVKTEMATQVVEMQAKEILANQEFLAKVRQVSQMMDTLPPSLWGAYIHDNYLEQFQPLAEERLRLMMPAEAKELKSAAPQAIAINPGNAIADLTEREDAIDYSWMDDVKFNRASTAVFAPKGSGKSFYISYRAAKYVEQNPTGVLWIIDPHFNEHTDVYSNDADDQETVWLNGIPKQTLYAKDGKLRQLSLVKSANAAFRVFKEFAKIGRDRVARGAKREHPVHIICDEFENRLRQWTEEQAEEALEIIAECEDEWRKYGMGITVCMHSIKKGNTKIDSAIVFQMNLLALGSALADTTVKFPSDLEAPVMAKKRNEIDGHLNHKTEGYAAVLKMLNQSPEIVVIKVIDPYEFSFEIAAEDAISSSPSDPTKPTAKPIIANDTDWYEEIKQWLYLQAALPNDGEIRIKWQGLTGNILNERGLALLKQNLSLP